MLRPSPSLTVLLLSAAFLLPIPGSASDFALLGARDTTPSAGPTPQGHGGSGMNAAASPLALARAMEDQPGLVTSAIFHHLPPLGNPTAVATVALGGFPRAGADYAILSSGNALLADAPNTSPSTSASNGGIALHGGSAFDVYTLEVALNVPALPAVDLCLGFDYRFLTEEYPEWGSTRRFDAFLAEVDAHTWTLTDPLPFLVAPNNFARGGPGEAVSATGLGISTVTADNAAGTTYDGATSLIRAETLVGPGAHKLYLSIVDVGDRQYDSTIFLDRLQVRPLATGESCETHVVADATTA